MIDASSHKQAPLRAAADIERWKAEDGAGRRGRATRSGGEGGSSGPPTGDSSGFAQLSPGNRQAISSASASHGGPAHFERFLDETVRPGLGRAGELNANDWVGAYLNSLPAVGITNSQPPDAATAPVVGQSSAVDRPVEIGSGGTHLEAVGDRTEADGDRTMRDPRRLT